MSRDFNEEITVVTLFSSIRIHKIGSRIVLFGIPLLFFIYATQSLLFFFNTPYFDRQITLSYLRGSSPNTLLDLIRKYKGKREDVLFFLQYILKRIDFKYGEYEVWPTASLYDIFKKMRSGESKPYAIRLNEGGSVHQFIKTLEAHPHLSGTIEKIPEEGSLLPDTYLFKYETNRNDVIKRLQKEMMLFLEKQGIVRPEDRHFVLTLASIVEKETGLESEKPIVASVFLNRLKKKMRLQSDPTVIYALTQGKEKLQRLLTKQDLKMDSLYNTYLYAKIPPTPIACSSRSSILAVLTPSKTPYLYFVANGKGGHSFSETLSQHNKNVQKWRESQKS